MVCITDLSESEALHKFIYGLKPVITARVLIANPSDINEAMQFAQFVDDMLNPRNPYIRRPAPSYRFGYNQGGAVPMDLDALQEVEEEAQEDVLCSSSRKYLQEERMMLQLWRTWTLGK